MPSKKKPTDKTPRLKIQLKSFYTTNAKEAKATFKALDWAWGEADNHFYGMSSIQKTLARLRDLAAVSIGKPTLAEEDNY